MPKKEKLIIAGPCALESQDHAHVTIDGAKKLGVTTVRGNLWKPRTKSGFEGIGEEGIPLLQEMAEEGLGVALEVMIPEQAIAVVEGILTKVPHASLLLWMGSRNQNHLILREIASLVSGEGNVQLMLKNQPWRSKDHWLGMISHALAGGISEEQLLMCHRGFAPWDKSSTDYRNIPDLEMAEEVKEETQLPMILDPSHIAGEKELVIKEAESYGDLDWVDGQIIEVHPDPVNAKTDAKQQLTWEELAMLLPIISK